MRTLEPGPPVSLLHADVTARGEACGAASSRRVHFNSAGVLCIDIPMAAAYFVPTTALSLLALMI